MGNLTRCLLEEQYRSSHLLMCVVEDCFFIQILHVPTRKEALMDLLLTNQENLLWDIPVTDNHCHSGNSIVDSGTLLSMWKVGTKTKILGSRKAYFSSLRVWLGGLLGETFLEDKGANGCWELFKNGLLEAQKEFINFKDKGSNWRKRLPWLNCEFLNMSKNKSKLH